MAKSLYTKTPKMLLKFKNTQIVSSLAVQWPVGLSLFARGGLGSLPSWGTKILQARGMAEKYIF